jgi:hypothetical protein
MALNKTVQYRLAKGLRIAARVIGLAVTLFGLMMAVGEGIQSYTAEGFKGFNLEFLQGLLVLLTVVIALAGCIISWWRVRLAGILLIVAPVAWSIAVIFNPIVCGQNWSMSFLIGSLLHYVTFGSPFLLAGVLFLLSWWLSKKTA